MDLGLVLGAIGSAIASKAVDWTLDAVRPGWERQLAKRAVGTSGIAVPKRSLTKWLEDSVFREWIVLASPQDFPTVAASLGQSAVRSFWTRGTPITEEQATTLLEHIAGHFLGVLEPSLAVSFDSRRQSQKLDSVSSGLDEILSYLKPSAAGIDLPGPVRVRLHQAFRIDRKNAERLAQLLSSNSKDPRALVEDLLADVPPWIAGSSYHLLWALGEFASAHHLHELAAIAFERVAVGALPHPARALSRAAVSRAAAGDPEASEELMMEAMALPVNEDLYVQMSAAVLGNDLGEVLRLAASDGVVDPIDDLEIRSWVVQARYAEAERTQAIAELEVLVGEYPDSAGLSLLLARWLVARALESAADERYSELNRARGLALRSRDLRRKWHGPSGEPAALAAEIAFNLGLVDDAMRTALPSPDGQANEIEWRTPRLVEIAGLASLASGRTDILEKLAVDRLPQVQRLLVAGWVAQEAGRTESAESLLREAFDNASDPIETRTVQLALAGLGVLVVPGLDELAEKDPVTAYEVQAIAHDVRGEHRQVIDLLKAQEHVSLRSAALLAEAYYGLGDLVSVRRTLEGAARTFKDGSVLCRLAMMEYTLDRHAARRVAIRALAALPVDSDDRNRMHRLLVQVGADTGDWTLVEEHARRLIGAGDDSPTTRWALVMGLYNQGEPERAWKALERAPVEPEDETQARLWMALHLEFSPSESTVRRALKVAHRFRGSEQVEADALAGIYSMSSRSETVLSDSVREELHAATQSFVERFPDSRSFYAIDASDPEALVAQLGEAVRPGSTDLYKLTSDVSIGRTPYGMLAASSGRSYAEVLVRKSAGCLPIFSAQSEVIDVLTAIESRGVAMVVDTSVFNVAGSIRDFWPLIRAELGQFELPRDTYLDSVAGASALAMRPTGWLGWDGEQGRLRFAEISRSQADELYDRATWMASEMAATYVVDDIEWVDLDPYRVEGMVAWMAPLQLALQKGLPLYTDDIAQRLIARSMGIRCFGTVGLILVMRDEGLLSEEQVSVVLCQLAQGFFVDLPLGWDDLLSLAELDGFESGAAAFVLSRIPFWADLAAAVEQFLRVYSRVRLVAREAAPSWVYHASLGLARAALPGSVLDLVARLVAAVTMEGSLWDPSSFLANLDAATAALVQVTEGDLCTAVVAHIHGLVSATLDANEAAEVIFSLTRDLDDERRLAAFRYVLEL